MAYNAAGTVPRVRSRRRLEHCGEGKLDEAVKIRRPLQKTIWPRFVVRIAGISGPSDDSESLAKENRSVKNAPLEARRAICTPKLKRGVSGLATIGSRLRSSDCSARGRIINAFKEFSTEKSTRSRRGGGRISEALVTTRNRSVCGHPGV